MENELTRCIAIDCEMVGIGTRGERVDMLARVSLVNESGDCVYDTFVKPTARVTNYRTPISGVRKKDLDKGEDYDVVQRTVKKMLQGRILIGHSVEHDLKVLKITHPKKDTRDTVFYGPFQAMNNYYKPSLKFLARRLLGQQIQKGEHSSIEDARAVMKIYQKVAAKWERTLGN